MHVLSFGAAADLPLTQPTFKRMAGRCTNRALPLLVLYSQAECQWCERARREYLVPTSQELLAEDFGTLSPDRYGFRPASGRFPRANQHSPRVRKGRRDPGHANAGGSTARRANVTSRSSACVWRILHGNTSRSRSTPHGKNDHARAADAATEEDGYADDRGQGRAAARDIRHLGRILGDTVRAQEGEAVVRRINTSARARSASAATTTGGAPRARGDARCALARPDHPGCAPSAISHLANIAEDQHHRHHACAPT